PSGYACQLADELLSQSYQRVSAGLADIQKALDKAGNRQDEQLAYYVAQTREVIDLSVSAQKDVIDAAAALRRAEPSEAGSWNSWKAANNNRHRSGPSSRT